MTMPECGFIQIFAEKSSTAGRFWKDHSQVNDTFRVLRKSFREPPT